MNLNKTTLFNSILILLLLTVVGAWLKAQVNKKSYRKILLVTIVSFYAFTQVVAQLSRNTLALENENIEVKSKNQKTAAWILLGGGTALTITGLAIASNNLWTDLGKDYVQGEALFYAGIVIAAASIPLFILSKRNAKRVSLSFSSDRIYRTIATSRAYQNIPCIKFKIDLSKKLMICDQYSN